MILVLEKYDNYTSWFDQKYNFFSRYPVLYLVPPSKIRKRLTLLNAIFAPAELRPLIRNNPNILCDSWQEVSDKMMYIHTVCMISLTNMLILADLPVSVLLFLLIYRNTCFVDNDIFFFILQVMGLEQPQIAASQALQKSLLHIKIRHLFLSRAGIYVKPNLLRDKMSYKRNPSLSDITDTSNRFFANRWVIFVLWKGKIHIC